MLLLLVVVFAGADASAPYLERIFEKIAKQAGARP